MDENTMPSRGRGLALPAWVQPAALAAAPVLWVAGLFVDGTAVMVLHALGCLLLVPGLAWPPRGGSWVLWVEPLVQTALALTALLFGLSGAGLLWLLAVRVLTGAARLYENYERRRAARRLDTLPDTAQVFRDGRQQNVASGEVRLGEPVIVPPDSVIPVDATVVKGESLTGLSPLTAGADMRQVSAGHVIRAGCRNETGLLAVKAEGVGENTLTRAWRRQTLAAAEQTPIRFRRLRLALLLWAGLAAVLAVITALCAPSEEAPARAVAAALTAGGMTLLYPLAAVFRRGLYRAAEKGARLGTPDALWTLAGVKAVLFSRSGVQAGKTHAVVGMRLAAGADRDTLLRCAAIAMMNSDTPTGHSVIEYCGDVGYPADSYSHCDGGVIAHFSGHILHAGDAAFLRSFDVEYPDEPQSALCVALDNRALGSLLLSESLRDGAEPLAAELKRRGTDMALITSAPRSEAERLGEKLGIADIHAEIAEPRLRPIVQELFSENQGHALFLGSALTDSDLLAAAPMAVCVDGLEVIQTGIPCAVVLPGASPEGLGRLLRQAQRLRRFTLIAAAVVLAVKLGCAALAFAGWLPAEAVIGAEALLLVGVMAIGQLTMDN